MARSRHAASGQTAALVRPPRFAQGGGAALPFGTGAPGMPRAGTARAQALARQWRDDARGRFTERVFEFGDSGLIAPDTVSQQLSLGIVSNRTSFVRLVAIRGSVTGVAVDQSYVPGLTEANFRLRLQINGEEDLITDGEGASYASYADLFTVSAPWFWFAAPPRLRVNDKLAATWFNATGQSGIQPAISIAGTLSLRIVDDAWWQALYGT